MIDQDGYWTREQLVEMNRRAVARMRQVLREDLARQRDPRVCRLAHRPVLIRARYTWGGLSQDTLTPSARHVIDAVCRRHGVSRVALRGGGRERRVVLARHEAMYRLREEVGLSLPVIGRLLCRDHTTVLHGVRRHAERCGVTA